MTDLDSLLAELHRIAENPFKSVEPPQQEVSTDFGGDTLKSDAYKSFVDRHPEWPEFYRKYGRDATRMWLNHMFRNHTCRACGQKGHSHHPACRCRECF